MSGLEVFNAFILVFMVVAAVISLRVKDLLTASVVFGIYSFLMCLLGRKWEPWTWRSRRRRLARAPAQYS